MTWNDHSPPLLWRGFAIYNVYSFHLSILASLGASQAFTAGCVLPSWIRTVLLFPSAGAAPHSTVPPTPDINIVPDSARNDSSL